MDIPQDLQIKEEHPNFKNKIAEVQERTTKALIISKNIRRSVGEKYTFLKKQLRFLTNWKFQQDRRLGLLEEEREEQNNKILQFQDKIEDQAETITGINYHNHILLHRVHILERRLNRLTGEVSLLFDRLGEQDSSDSEESNEEEGIPEGVNIILD